LAEAESTELRKNKQVLSALAEIKKFKFWLKPKDGKLNFG
jgi:hypothetical protein